VCAAWNQVLGEVDNWSSRSKVGSGEMPIDEALEEEEEELDGEQDELQDEDLEEHDRVVVVGVYTGSTWKQS
jgi:hypothetical protein